MNQFRSSDRPAVLRWLEAMAAVAVIAASGTLIWFMVSERRASAPPATRSVPAQAPPPAEPVSIEGAATKGRAEAPVVVIEYSEFQCPFCGSFARDTFPRLDEVYIKAGSVLWVFKHFPLENIHPFALRAGASAECARRQGRFWDMHDLLFRDQKRLEDPVLRQHASQLGLNLEQFSDCLSGDASASVRKDLDEGKALRVSGTPYFLVGAREAEGKVRVLHRLAGANQLDQFRQVLDLMVKRAR